MAKLMTAEEAVKAYIKDGMTIATMVSLVPYSQKA